MKCQPPASTTLAERAGSRRSHWGASERKILPRVEIVPPQPFPEARNPGCRVAPVEGGLSMHARATSPHYQELDRLGDEIAELSAHLDAATARLLDLIREFDARGGWNSGFSSCAAWLSWRVGLDLGAARERVRVARALGSLPSLAAALSRGELSYAKVRALTRVATPETEERLLVVGRAGTADHVNALCAAGAGWTARPKPPRLPNATRAERSMCFKAKTV